MVGGLATKATGIVLDVARQRGGAMPGVVTLHDHSRFGNDGAMTNMAWVQLPSGLWVPSFNGVSSYADCGVDNSLDMGSGDFTVLFWFCRAPIFISETFCIKGGTGIAGKRYLASLTGGAGLGQPRFQIDDDGGGGLREIQSAGNFADNIYHLYGGMRDGNNIRLFLDGVEDAASPTAIGAYGSLDQAHSLLIGCGFNHATLTRVDYYEGYIAIIRIYSYALSPAQIRSRFNATRRLFGV